LYHYSEEELTLQSVLQRPHFTKQVHCALTDGSKAQYRLFYQEEHNVAVFPELFEILKSGVLEGVRFYRQRMPKETADSLFQTE